ncbi:MAG: AraC family transcriptional regulator [Clostridium sp.]|nr:AraC family transcriptional regulator [Clostridium sp.]
MSSFYENRIEPYKSYQVTDYEFSPHLHNQFEIVYALSGSCDISIDHHTYRLHSNDFAIIFPYQLHHFSHSDHCTLLVQTFDPDYAPSYIPFLGSHIPQQPILQNINEDFAYAVKKAHEYHVKRENASIIRSYVSVYMSFLFTCIHLIPCEASDHQDITRQLLIYVDKHYTAPLTLEILANEMHVTRFYISRLFTKKLHTTFPAYINRLRIEYALSLLHSSTLSISQIAYECGFESERTFFREFHKQIHMTPLQFQKNGLHSHLD